MDSFKLISELYEKHLIKIKKFENQVGKGISEDVFKKFAEKSLLECQNETHKILNDPNNFVGSSSSNFDENEVELAKLTSLKSKIKQLQSEVEFNKSLGVYMQQSLTGHVPHSSSGAASVSSGSNVSSSGKSTSNQITAPDISSSNTNKKRSRDDTADSDDVQSTSKHADQTAASTIPSSAAVAVHVVETESTVQLPIVSPSTVQETTAAVVVTSQQPPSRPSTLSTSSIKLTKGSEASANKILMNPDIKERIKAHVAVIFGAEALLASRTSGVVDKAAEENVLVSVQFIRVLFKSKLTPMALIDESKVLDGLIRLILTDNDNDLLLERTLVCVFHLLNNHRENSQKRIRHAISLGLLPRLVELLAAPGTLVDILQDCLCILINISLDGEECLDQVVQAKPLPTLLKFVSEEQVLKVQAGEVRPLLQVSNLLRILSAHVNIAEFNPLGADQLPIYDRILLLLRATKDPNIVNNGCRILLSAVLQSLATVPPLSEENAAALGFTIESFMRKDGILHSLIDIMRNRDQLFGETAQHNALMAFLVMVRLLTPESVMEMDTAHGLLAVLLAMLNPAVLTGGNENQVKKLCDVCKCLSEMKSMSSDLVELTISARAKLQEILRSGGADSELVRHAKLLLF